MRAGDMGICSGCGELSVAITCCDEIADYQFGQPAVQRHYYLGSTCCGEPIDEGAEDDDI